MRIAFLQDLFEKSAKISPKERAVVIPVSSFSLVALVRLLKDLNVPSHIFGTDPISVAVRVDDAVRLPLFNAEARSKKYRRAASLASKNQECPVANPP